MVLRFFGFIWGAILVTLILFALLIFFLEPGAPEPVVNELERQIVLRQLSQVAQSEGRDVALEIWQFIAPVHPGLTITPDPGCTAAAVIRDNQDQCLSVEQSAKIPVFPNKMKPFLVPLGLGAVISAIAAILLSRRLTMPIRTVNRGLKALEAGQLATRIQPQLNTSDRELVELAVAFDNAAARLQELTENRQQLFHDISHEIRSPLARLRAAIGLVEQNPRRSEGLLGQMTTDIGQLDHLVDEILTLARFERGPLASETEDLDLLDIIEPILADANFEGRPRGISVLYNGADQLNCSGDAELLHRAFENIVRNALTYSPDKGSVILTGIAEPHHLIVEVADEGPGVAKADLANLFTPFVRLGDSDQTTSGGLGLAIAARAIEGHNGTISAKRGPKGGLIIRVEVRLSH